MLGRQFTADRRSAWVGDTAEFLSAAGTKLFVAAILDLYRGTSSAGARESTTGSHIKATDAIKRRPSTRGCSHSDQAALPARTISAGDDSRITCSMSRRGNCYDNAVMESYSPTGSSTGENSRAARSQDGVVYYRVFYTNGAEFDNRAISRGYERRATKRAWSHGNRQTRFYTAPTTVSTSKRRTKNDQTESNCPGSDQAPVEARRDHRERYGVATAAAHSSALRKSAGGTNRSDRTAVDE